MKLHLFIKNMCNYMVPLFGRAPNFPRLQPGVLLHKLKRAYLLINKYAFVLKPVVEFESTSPAVQTQCFTF